MNRANDIHAAPARMQHVTHCFSFFLDCTIFY